MAQEGELMTNPPTELDGAILLWFTPPRPEQNYGFVSYVNENHEIDYNRKEPISALAICQYSGSDEVYVFACNAQWRVIGDLVYDSVEEAKTDAERYYNETQPIYWIKLGDN